MPLQDTVKGLGDAAQSSEKMLEGLIRQVFGITSREQRAVLSPKLAVALLRAGSYCTKYNLKSEMKFVEKVYEITVGMHGKGRADMREALKAAIGMEYKTQAKTTEKLLGIQ